MSGETAETLADAETVVRLFVTGRGSLSDRAQRNLRNIARSVGGLAVEVVDILENPDEAEAERVVATPLLVRLAPEPPKRVFGDLSDTSIVMSELELRPAG